MGNQKKKTAIKTKKIMLGDAAQSFFDASTGIFIGKGDVKELSVRQYNSPKIKKALTNGHLVIVMGDVPSQAEENAEDLKAKFDTLMNQGMEASKIAKAFTLPEIKEVAKQYDLEPDDDDTVDTLVEAIISEIEGTAKED